MTADISPLVGRSYVCKSLNVCRVQRLGDGAVRVVYQSKPTPEDMGEIEGWMRDVLGDVVMAVNVGSATEAAALAAWKRDAR